MTTNHPVKVINQTKEDNARLRYLSQEEYHRLIEATDSNLLKAAISMAVGTMLRRSNLFALEWNHLNFEAETITIPGEMTKNSKPLIIDMITPVREVLQELPRALHSPYVLTNPRTGKSYAGYAKSV